MSAELPLHAGSWASRVTSATSIELPLDWPNRDSSRELKTDGLRWHFQRMGSGPALLLVHGTAAATHTWRDLMPILSAHFDVLAVDLPGHGFSDKRRDGDMSLPAIAQSLSALLGQLNFHPQYAAGHSAGAAIVLRMLADKAIQPQTIVGLNAALLPFGGSMSALFAPMAKAFAGLPMMTRLITRRAQDPASVRRILLGTGSDIDPRGIAFYQQLLQRETHVSAVLSMMASWRLEGFLEGLADMPCRLELLCGLNDKAVSPEEANSVARKLPQARITRMENCGHLAHEEQPDRVAKFMLQACQASDEADHDQDS